jgi:Sigma-70 region 2
MTPRAAHGASFQAVRPRLFGIAYRTLESAVDAADAVQDTWIRWQGTDRNQSGPQCLSRARDRLAATVTGLATGAPPGGHVEVGGPEALGVDAWGRRLFAATGDERTVIGDPHARYFGTDLHGGELTPGDGARIGTIDFETWFATHPQGARR